MPNFYINFNIIPPVYGAFSSRIREGVEIIEASLIGMAPKKTVGKRYKNAAYLKALGEHCRELRIKLGYSIDRMAREGDQLSRGSIHRLEAGLGDPQATVLLRYAQVLGVKPKRLLDFEF